MKPHARPLYLVLLTLMSAASLAAGFQFHGPGDPIPVPPNPGNNPWLNYPTHYGAGSKPHAFGEHTPVDMAASLDRFMKLDEAGRTALSQREEQASLARGKVLFNDSRLGTSGLTCAACHPNGDTAGGRVVMAGHEVAIASLMNVATRYPRYKAIDNRVITQSEMQNNCLTMFLKGRPLASGSRDAADLTFYVGSFRNPSLTK